ncbi:MAG: hypothetical protein JW769_02395 [Parachlamydiales bacterium]|nr:hypothetical protein [Parachlamydiales bacterium]
MSMDNPVSWEQQIDALVTSMNEIGALDDIPQETVRTVVGSWKETILKIKSWIQGEQSNSHTLQNRLRILEAENASLQEAVKSLNATIANRFFSLT